MRPLQSLSINVESSRVVMEPMRPLQRSVRQCWVQYWSWSQWGHYKGLSVNVESSTLFMEPMRPLQGSVRQCWVQ